MNTREKYLQMLTKERDDKRIALKEAKKLTKRLARERNELTESLDGWHKWRTLEEVMADRRSIIRMNEELGKLHMRQYPLPPKTKRRTQ